MRNLFIVLGLVGCGGSRVGGGPGPAGRDGDGAIATSAEAEQMRAASRMGPDPESKFGPLEVGADYLRYRRVTPEPFLSLVHGSRWVHVYVNEIGADAYLDGGDIPAGTIIVKASWLDADQAPSNARGPIYVMEKRALGYAPDRADWYYAIHWDSPAATMYGGPIYWRGSSHRVEFCTDCHDSYDRSLGGLIPSSQLPR